MENEQVAKLNKNNKTRAAARHFPVSSCAIISKKQEIPKKKMKRMVDQGGESSDSNTCCRPCDDELKVCSTFLQFDVFIGLEIKEMY